ncbi:MAG TPA: DNA translocase FtsK [Bacilli bacterium]
MARKRKKSAKRHAVLKYEVYGILMIVLSVISVAGKGLLPGLGTVGRSLSYINFFLLGRWYFVIPMFFIFLGFLTMTRKKMSPLWRYRLSGTFVFIWALAIFTHLQLIELMFPKGNIAYAQLFAEPFDNLRQLLASSRTELDVRMFKQNLGGGMIGAISTVLFVYLFGSTGTSLIDYALFAIGFIYITGLSYVELGGKIKRAAAFLAGLLLNKLAAFIKLFRIKQSALQKQRDIRRRTTITLATDEDLNEETLRPRHAGKSVFGLLRELLAKDQSDPPEQTENSDAADDGENVTHIAPVLAEADSRADAEESDLPRFHDSAAYAETERYGAIPRHQAHDHGAADASLDEEADKVEFSGSKPGRDTTYTLPPFHLLNKPAPGKSGEQFDFKSNARKLEATLESFGVRTKVLDIVKGPAVTRYEIQPDVGVKVSRIVNLADDIALALAAKDLRMEAPIPGKSAIGIEVPNSEISMVTIREVMESAAFNEAESKLSIVLGRDISGVTIVANLAKMPHLLVAGATGSGKSVCINGMITSILYKAKPDEVKFLMIDPKMVELNVYNGIPHLLAPVVTDPRRASLALKKVVQEMEKRYELFSKTGTRNMEGYNAIAAEIGEETLPYIVVIVDELADLMMVAANDVEDAICRLAQMARAAGIHLIIATQRPSVDVITGLIKANIPSRIAFGVSSQVDSRTILDTAGAEKLLGRGDMLFLPVGASKPIRVQGAFVSDHEVEAVVQFVRSQEQASYREEMVPEVEETAEEAHEPLDELFNQAVQIVLEARQASVSLLQRRLRIGYTRAARLIDAMEASGIVGPYEGSKPREVLMTLEQFQRGRMSS